jgi:hypothetical protein
MVSFTTSTRGGWGATTMARLMGSFVMSRWGARVQSSPVIFLARSIVSVTWLLTTSTKPSATRALRATSPRRCPRLPAAPAQEAPPSPALPHPTQGTARFVPPARQQQQVRPPAASAKLGATERPGVLSRAACARLARPTRTRVRSAKTTVCSASRACRSAIQDRRPAPQLLSTAWRSGSWTLVLGRMPSPSWLASS